MIRRRLWRAGLALVVIAVLSSGVVASGQSTEELLGSLQQVLDELIALRQSLWDLEMTIITTSTPDLLALEATNFEYERRILQLTGRFLAIREAMHGIVPPLVIEQEISLVKAELAAAWLENSMIEGKLSIKKKELLAQAVANDPPRSCFTVPDAVYAGAPVRFLDCSTDLEGDIESWSWLFGDGGASDEPSPTHVYASAGRYDVSLVVADEDGATARFSATVEARQAYGALSVLSDSSLQAYLGESPKTILIIFDTSSSMEQSFEGSTRLAAAKQVLKDFLGAVPRGVSIGLRIFGSCTTSTLLFPVQPLDASRMAGVVDGIQAKGATPLALSLDRAAADLAGIPDAKAILLITDGQETCEGDPIGSAQQLVAQIADVRIHVVGFEVATDLTAQRQLAEIAAAGGGLYVDATSSGELASALRLVAPITFRVVDASGTVRSAGVLGDPVPQLAAEAYEVMIDLPTGGAVSVSVDVVAGGSAVVRVGHSADGYYVDVE